MLPLLPFLASCSATGGGADFGVAAADRQSKVQGATLSPINVVLHEFGTVTIGAETISEPTVLVTIMKDQIGNTCYSMLPRADHIRNRWAWIAFSDFRIFAGFPGAKAAQPQPQPQPHSK